MSVTAPHQNIRIHIACYDANYGILRQLNNPQGHTVHLFFSHHNGYIQSRGAVYIYAGVFLTLIFLFSFPRLIMFSSQIVPKDTWGSQINQSQPTHHLDSAKTFKINKDYIHGLQHIRMFGIRGG